MSDTSNWPDGVVYTETVVYSAPERYAAEAPYQVAIIETEGRRVTVRIESGHRVQIGDRVTFVRESEHVRYYRKT